MKSIFHIALLSVVIALVVGLTTTTIVPKAIAQNENKSEKLITIIPADIVDQRAGNRLGRACRVAADGPMK